MIDFLLFSTALRDLIRARRLFWVAAFTLLVPVLAFIICKYLHPSSRLWVYDNLASTMVFGFVLVILAVLFATGALTQELEQRTIVYLLTRPVERWRILLARFLAASVMATAAAWIAIIGLALVTVGVHHLGEVHLGRDLLILPVAALAYSGIFLFLAALTGKALVPLVVGLLYGFLWESLIPQLPGNFKLASLMSYVHVLAPHGSELNSTQTNSATGMLLASSTTGYTITHTVAWVVLLSVIVISLASSLVVFSVREYVPREEAG